MEKKHISRKPGVFYGYRIMVATFFMAFIHAGSGFFAYSLFVRPLQADLGWSRGSIMTAFAVFYLMVGVASVFVGRLIDRYGARRVIFAGALVAGAGFVSLSLIGSLWQFYLSYAIVGAGLAAVGFVPASAVISNWFRKRRGLAIGIMSTGVGVGGLALAPLIGGYVIPRFGWSTGYQALAIIVCAVVIPLALLVIRTKPEEMGLHPDGLEASEVESISKASSSIAQGLTLKMALGTSAFWLISLTFLSSTFGHVAVIQNQVPHLEDIGFPVTMAATALGGVGLASAIGKFFFGWLCDHVPAKYSCTIGLVLQIAAIVVIMNLGSDSPLALIWLYAILMGLGVGSWLPTMSMMTSSSFGLAAYGAIFGWITLAQSSGTATGPLMAGFLYDATGSYHRVFIISLSIFAIAIPSALAVRRPKSL